MFVGHALLAFAVAAALAHAVGWPRERALALGLAAGAFATVPDVDILYGPVGVVGADGPMEAADGFWRAGNRVHRGVTHSLPVGAVAAVAAYAWRRADPAAPSAGPGTADGAAQSRGAAWRAVAAGLLAALAAVALLASGPLAATVTVAFAAGTLGVAVLARRLSLGAGATGLAAGLGFFTHPFGDLFTGAPPAMLYPADATLVAERVSLHPDPTLALLGAMGVELATAWLAVLVFLWIDGDGLSRHVGRRCAAGAAYAGAVFLAPAPTLDACAPFVFGALGLGLVAAAPVPRSAAHRVRGPSTAAGGWRGRGRWPPRRAAVRAAVTGLGAVTLAAVAYALAYAFVGGAATRAVGL